MLRTLKQSAGMAGKITATPRDVTGWKRSREAGRCLSTEFTGYEGMEGAKGTRKTESLTFLGFNIKIITINHIGVFVICFGVGGRVHTYVRVYACGNQRTTSGGLFFEHYLPFH